MRKQEITQNIQYSSEETYFCDYCKKKITSFRPEVQITFAADPMDVGAFGRSEKDKDFCSEYCYERYNDVINKLKIVDALKKSLIDLNQADSKHHKAIDVDKFIKITGLY